MLHHYSCITEETFIHDFPVIRKRPLQKIVNKCFLYTACTVDNRVKFLTIHYCITGLQSVNLSLYSHSLEKQAYYKKTYHWKNKYAIIIRRHISIVYDRPDMVSHIFDLYDAMSKCNVSQPIETVCFEDKFLTIV